MTAALFAFAQQFASDHNALLRDLLLFVHVLPAIVFLPSQVRARTHEPSSPNHIMEIESYRNVVSLDHAWAPSTSTDALQAADIDAHVDSALEHLLDLNGIADKASVFSSPYPQRRALLRDLLTVWNPTGGAQLPLSVAASIDAVLQAELAAKNVTVAAKLPRVTDAYEAAQGLPDDLADVLSKIAVWRGDITALRVDAIMNAANSALLGCFQPEHRCIDNVIHAAAGPQLRVDCAKIVSALGGREEPVGSAKATRAYNLPSRFVIHTVGPAIRGGAKVTRVQEEQLSSSYRASLDVAATLPNVSSIAFCCVSTGLFGFPKDRASQIAVATVAQWLAEHPSGPIDLVVFNVFTEEDASHYDRVFRSITSPYYNSDEQLPTTSADAQSQAIAAAVEWIKQVDYVLVAGGAGLSASAGLDYNDRALFKKLFPAMHRRGHRCMYEFIGYHDWSEELRWGYLFSQINLARFNWPQHAVYQRLLDIVKAKAPGGRHFVLTSNADGMFERNGFDPSRILTRQGDYSRMQCLKRCTENVWPLRPLMERALPSIDPATQEITDPEAVPKCPHCGGPVIMNVRGGSWFIDTPYRAQEAALAKFLASTRGKRLVVIEVGVGFNTPSVVRWPCEAAVAGNKNARLVRINDMYPDVPEELAGRAVGLSGNAVDAVVAIADGVLGRQ